MKAKIKKVSRSRKTSKTPTRVYEYGVYKVTNGLDYIQDQLYKSHKYRNNLTTVERNRRARIRKVMKVVNPELEKLENNYEALKKKRNEIYVTKLSGLTKEERSPEVLKELADIKSEQKTITESIKKERAKTIKTHFESMDRKWKNDLNKELLKAIVDLGRLPKEVLKQPYNGLSKDEYNEYVSCAVGTRASKYFKNALLGPNSKERREAKLRVTDKLMKKGGAAWCTYKKVIEHADKRNKIIKRKCGLGPGTSHWVEEAAKQSFNNTIFLPKYKKFDNTGCVGIQLTESSSEPGVMGLSVDRLMSCQDNRFKILYQPDVRIRKSNGIRTAALSSIKMEGRRNDAVFVDLQTIIHRDLPKDGIIKWAYVKACRVGFKVKYKLQITLESKSFILSPATKGEVSVDLGWRRLNNGDIRIATTWNGKKESYLDISSKMFERDAYKTYILSISDKVFNSQKKVVCNWLKDNMSLKVRKVLETLYWKDDLTKLNKKEFTKAVTKRIIAWKNHSKLIRLSNLFVKEFFPDISKLEAEWKRSHINKPKDISWSKWRENNTPSDLFVEIESLIPWLKQKNIIDEVKCITFHLRLWVCKEIHLVNWGRNMENKSKLYRKEIYRRLAFNLSNSYKSCVIADWDKISVIQKPAAEDKQQTYQEENANAIRQFVGPSVLKECLIKRFGDNLFAVNSKEVNRTHFGCGGNVVKNVKSEQSSCDKCNHTFNHDLNSAKNLLLAASF